MTIPEICKKLHTAQADLALHTAAQKNHALSCVAEAIDKNRDAIIAANKADLDAARAKGMSEALLERLMLDAKRIDGIISSMGVVIAQSDPIGEVTGGWDTPTGLSIKQVRVPLGVVAIIYESRPNVTVDAFCLAYKSGNAILLRGSSSALNSNRALIAAIQQGLQNAGADGVAGAVALCEPQADHSDVDQILTAVGLIDCVLPRGGAKLIQNVVQNAKIPVIETGAGVCHLFVDESADLEKAARIAENAKIQRPGACNAIECILVHEKIAADYLPLLAKQLAGRVELRCDKASFDLFNKAVSAQQIAQKDCRFVPAQESDFGFEFLDLVCAVKIMSGIEEAISYINTHSTKHSESICTNDRAHARMFQAQIDSACVYVNASTRFTDGGEFGFGAELGISTQKLHARGPMGIKALTTTKFLIDGDGQVR
ncbi:MAG: glutamate-5-semialdehyde dehydrogenase [Treponema sp.]|nr:glutamate-5-semialdehyde dehydrogenase [Treponema sp.]